MKKIILLSLAFFALTAFNTTFAQVKSNAIKLNLVGLVAGQYQIAYERAINEKISVQLSAGYITRNYTMSVNGAEVAKYSISGLIVIPEARYYFQEGLKGAYAGAFFRYRGVTRQYDETNGSKDQNDLSHTSKATAVGGGLVLGYQVLISDAVVIDIFAGPQFKSSSSSIKAKYGADLTAINALSFKGGDKTGVGVRFGFNLGIAF